MAESKKVQHRNGMDRGLSDAFGHELRQRVPRSDHARWGPPPDRADPVELILQQDAARIPDLVPLRHQRMLVSPFTFLRGAAIVMAHDLASRRPPGCGSTQVATLICRISGSTARLSAT